VVTWAVRATRFADSADMTLKVVSAWMSGWWISVTRWATMAVLHSLDYEVVGCASLRPPCGRWISGQRSKKVVKDGSEKLRGFEQRNGSGGAPSPATMSGYQAPNLTDLTRTTKEFAIHKSKLN
jgi:hypothetical protein